MNLLSLFRNIILPVADINRALPVQGLVYEVGSGHGTLSVEIAKYSLRRTVVALDIDNDKIKVSKESFKYPNLRFENVNASSYKYKNFNGAVLSDFLHHIPFIIQEDILAKLADKLLPGGSLVIKEIDGNDGWRKWLSRLWDLILYPRDKIYYRSQSDWIGITTKLKLAVTISRKVPLFPGSTFLIICQKA